MATASKPATAIIHETNNFGQHRLVVIKAGIPTKSEWLEKHELGLFKGYYFQNGIAPILPNVFRATATAHEVLA